MKLSKIAFILSSSIATVFSYVNKNTGPVQIPSDVPTDCVTLFQIYEHFNLGRPGYIVGDVMFNCCYYEVRRLHSMDVYATTEWECENDTQDPNNHITSIMMNDKNLSGEIPWVLFNSFQNLQILYLNNNKLTGELSQLSYIKSLKNLQRVNLSSNMLTGLLPSDLPPNLTVLNVQDNDIVGPVPESWTSKSNFECLVPDSVCKPKSLTDYSSMCNSIPNSKALSECTDDQIMISNSLTTTNMPNASNDADVNSTINANNENVESNDISNVVNSQEETTKKEEERKSSSAVIFTFFSIICILGILVLLVAIFAKYKNVRHEREMEDSLRRHHENLREVQTQEDSFFKDAGMKSMDESNNFNFSKYSDSIHSNHRNGNTSDAGSRGFDGEIDDGNNKLGGHAHEHAIVMNNIDRADSRSAEFDNSGEFDHSDKQINQNSSNTIDLERSRTEPSYSLSYSSNKYNSTYTSLYDSSYCSTCDCSYSTVSSASSLSTSNSSFTEANKSSFSLNCTESMYVKSNSEDISQNLIADEIGSNVTLDFDSKHYLAKRSIISNSSYNTLFDQNINNNNLISTNPLINNSMESRPATVITSTSANTKFIDDENLKITLEDIEEEHSSSLSKNSQSIDLSKDLGKGLNMSFILKDDSFLNSSKQDAIELNW